MSKIYLYAIVDSSTEAQFVLKGLEGGEVYTIPYKDISAVVSNTDRVRSDLNEDHIIAHESVMEGLMDGFTVLPVRFFTLLEDKEALSEMLLHYYDKFIENLKKVRGKVELGVKILWPAEEIKLTIADSEAEETLKETSPGKRYMLSKRREYAVTEEFRKRGEGYIEMIDKDLSKYASDKFLEQLKTERLLLSASYLVEKDKIDIFKDTFEHVQDGFKDFKFMLSGPWPVYSFVNIGGNSQPLKKGLEKKWLRR